ncbi:hypothetical protein [Tenacibaculum sp. IB213877]|uniref:hypothetical protein n=1 Tax=Tenacibaculum sp. IB213877 TaxID=3097351 RepID=UPI002A5A2C83|nr:hypothetical protein [Tenacibaculum sp. IB213877]MDY0779274.1 hypothetical protein [Tenacibaculum sp. IB213877]
MKMNIEDKYKKLALSLIFDAIGFIPFLDIVWAPTSAYLMAKMYKGKEGKVAAVFSFIEEALPFLDVIPTFTIMWVYTYVFKGATAEKIKKTIEV